MLDLQSCPVEEDFQEVAQTLRKLRVAMARRRGEQRRHPRNWGWSATM